MRAGDDPAEQTNRAPFRDATALQKAQLYPEQLGPVIASLPGDADEFDVLRERLLLGYGYQTARAYWGDLEHWRDWCRAQSPAVAPLTATSLDILTNRKGDDCRFGVPE